MRVLLNSKISQAEPGTMERHFGWPFTVQADGSLIGDVPDDMAPNEIEAGRVTPLEVPPVAGPDTEPKPEAPKIRGKRGR